MRVFLCQAKKTSFFFHFHLLVSSFQLVVKNSCRDPKRHEDRQMLSLVAMRSWEKKRSNWLCVVCLGNERNIRDRTKFGPPAVAAQCHWNAVVMSVTVKGHVSIDSSELNMTSMDLARYFRWRRPSLLLLFHLLRPRHDLGKRLIAIGGQGGYRAFFTTCQGVEDSVEY